MSLAVILYDSGNADAPDDPFGHNCLELHWSGAARLWNRQRFRPVGCWETTFEPALFEEVAAALSEAGAWTGLIPPSATRRLRTSTRVGQTTSVILPWHGVDKLPGYGRAFSLLDRAVTLARQAPCASPEAASAWRLARRWDEDRLVTSIDAASVTVTRAGRWSTRFDGRATRIELRRCGELLLILTWADDTRLRALDAEGKLRWEIQLDGRGRPADVFLLSGGMMVVASFDGELPEARLYDFQSGACLDRQGREGWAGEWIFHPSFAAQHEPRPLGGWVFQLGAGARLTLSPGWGQPGD